MIDEFPICSSPAAMAKGRTVTKGLEELRVKESDRLALMASGLARLGAHVEESEDGLVIDGTDGTPLAANGPVEIAAELDHRIAMSFAVAGLAAANEVTIDDMAPVATSFPRLLGDATSSGGRGMIWDLPNIVGLIGSALMVIAYAYSNIVGARMNFILFNLLEPGGIGDADLVARRPFQTLPRWRWRSCGPSSRCWA